MRIVVALSGGVDSAVAAGLLREQGHEVVALTLRLFDCSEGVNERSCCGLAGVAAARAAAGQLGIPHYVVDGQDLFEARVLRRAWDDYDGGRTPNPCVACNEQLKLGLLYQQARKLGAQAVATGHHARIEHRSSEHGRSERAPTLWRGRDRHKDQSYFLFSLSPDQLSICRLPVGELTKPQVREHARALGLPNADRAESQDACIAQRGDFAEALRQRFDGVARPGAFVDRAGNVLGRHEGVHRFTVGQRKGLGIALGERAYVVAIDAELAEVVVDTDKQHLCADGLRAANVRWHAPIERGEAVDVEVQIRYRHRAVRARLHRLADDSAEVRFASPERAVAPGQAAVFYRGDRLLGGGWIERALDPTAASDARGPRGPS